MNVYLLLPNQDFDLSAPTKQETDPITSDLELETVFQAMSCGDTVIDGTVRSVLLRYLQEPDTILYRQEIVRDCLLHPAEIRQLYQITLNALEAKKKGHWWLSSSYLPALFSGAVDILDCFLTYLDELRKYADTNTSVFSSRGLLRLLAMLQQQLDDTFLEDAKSVLNELRFRDGTLIGLSLGPYNQGKQYTLLRKNPERFWRRWTFAPKFTLAPRDDAGAKDLSNRRDLALDQSVDILVESAEHVEDFFTRLRDELAFYIGVLNLCDRLRERNVAFCIPTILADSRKLRTFQTLCDVSLALSIQHPVGNSIHAEDQRLYIITGANQGGKSTFLRSVGQAQLMAQAGVIVAAEESTSHIAKGIFTHFKKEEDQGMDSGKLDEELLRMSGIVNHLQKDSLVLFNESFAATNEREGSELCREITLALVENQVEVFSVTHLFTFANQIYQQNRADTTFLRAERLADGKRTFQILLGRPLQTAYGQDLYNQIFQPATQTSMD